MVPDITSYLVSLHQDLLIAHTPSRLRIIVTLRLRLIHSPPKGTEVHHGWYYVRYEHNTRSCTTQPCASKSQSVRKNPRDTVTCLQAQGRNVAVRCPCICMHYMGYTKQPNQCLSKPQQSLIQRPSCRSLEKLRAERWSKMPESTRSFRVKISSALIQEAITCNFPTTPPEASRDMAILLVAFYSQPCDLFHTGNGRDDDESSQTTLMPSTDT